jgi:hypothetical protein
MIDSQSNKKILQNLIVFMARLCGRDACILAGIILGTATSTTNKRVETSGRDETRVPRLHQPLAWMLVYTQRDHVAVPRDHAYLDKS